EGGVDVTAAFKAAKLTAPSCFSSFLEETRSSQSTGAELKDFLASEFTLCGISISTQCITAGITSTNVATAYNFTGGVTKKGVGALYNVKVTDTYPTGASNFKPDYSAGLAITLPDICNTGNTTVSCLLPGNTASYSGSFDLPSTNNSAANNVSVAAGA